MSPTKPLPKRLRGWNASTAVPTVWRHDPNQRLQSGCHCAISSTKEHAMGSVPVCAGQRPLNRVHPSRISPPLSDSVAHIRVRYARLSAGSALRRPEQVLATGLDFL